MDALKAIARKLQEKASDGSIGYLEAYLDVEDQILNHITSIGGIKSEFYCYETEDVSRMTKYLALFSDFTSVFTAPSSKNEYQLQVYREPDPRNIQRQLTIPASLTNSSLNRGYPIMPSYLLKSDADFRLIIDSIDPFISNGTFLLRPMRALLVNLPVNTAPGAVQHEIFYAASDTPNNHWHAKEINEKDSIVINNGLKPFQSKTLLELTLPYFDGVSIEDLAKILDDESDLLGKFRVTLKELTKTIVDSDNVSEYINDKIRPEIEAINRKFQTIRSLHRLSVGASVASFTLALVGIQVSSSINFQTLFNTLVGSSAFGLLVTEVRYQTEVDKLKDNPYFLLWKISKAKG